MCTFQVADELVAEFADPGNSVASPDQVSCIFLLVVFVHERIDVTIFFTLFELILAATVRRKKY